MLDLTEGRYDRQERIWWWDQARLRSATVLVVGAGALGNEIVKNLSLIGVGSTHVVDMDHIEHSNLSRCALFREEHEGENKALALASAAQAMNPDVEVTGWPVRVQHLGSAFLARFDLVLGALDNREARLWVNAACRRLGIDWIDGAIEGLQGLARVFAPSGPCYECTLGEVDLANLAHRRSCTLLSAEEMSGGRTPTNATTAAIVAGVQVQEAVKLLVGRRDLVRLIGRVWRYDGDTMDTTVVEYIENPDCLAHDDAILEFDGATSASSFQQLVEEVPGGEADAEVAVYLFDDLVVIERCLTCTTVGPTIGLRGCLPAGAATCPSCATERRVSSTSAMSPGDDLWTESWTMWHWPREELVCVRVGARVTHAVARGSHG